MTLQLSELITSYNISNWGFLNDPFENAKELPESFDEYKPIIALISNQDSQRFREMVNNLEKGLPHEYYINKLNGLLINDIRRVYCAFTFIAQKYTKCMEPVITEIPYEIGLIWYHSAQQLGLPCVMTYASTILYNCKLDENGKLQSIYSISGTPDELHFYDVHITLENKCEQLMLALTEYMKNNSTTQALNLARVCAETIKQVTQILKTMYDKCKPEKFWKQVRLYLSGFTKTNGFENGLKIKGTDITFEYGGGSAAQSSLIQLLDIILGISHESEHGKKFLLDQRNYMPITHRNFLTFMEYYFEKFPLRSIATNDKSVRDEYNNAVNELRIFRLAHQKLVHDYIVKFIQTPATEAQGVGGLVFSELEQYVKDTTNTKLTNHSDKNVQFSLEQSTLEQSTLKWWLWTGGILAIAYIVHQCASF